MGWRWHAFCCRSGPGGVGPCRRFIAIGQCSVEKHMSRSHSCVVRTLAERVFSTSPSESGMACHATLAGESAGLTRLLLGIAQLAADAACSCILG